EGDGVDRIAVVLEGVQFRAAGYLPEFDGSIVAGGGKRLTIGTKGETVDGIFVGGERVSRCFARPVAGDGVDAHFGRLTWGAADHSEATAIGRVGESSDRLGQFTERAGDFARGRVEKDDLAVLGRGDQLAIGRISEGG